MLESLYSSLLILEDSLWSYVGFPFIILFGVYLSIKSRFVQIRKLPAIIKTFCGFFSSRNTQSCSATTGVHPLKAFFACIGGCVGIGNIVAICTAVQLGGPGALFWIWLTAIAGSILKYAEVYLGLRYRVPDGKGSYTGGPMHFLKAAFKVSWVPNLACLLLCIYGVEIYQFRVMNESIVTNFDLNRYLVTAVLLGLVIFASSGGVSRIGKVSSAIIPFFILLYLGMGFWILLNNLSIIPSIFGTVFASAFSGHAAVGGFAGSTLMIAISQGIRRGCYTSDVGVGYASIIHSESSVQVPEKQASLAVFEIFFDTFTICTMSIMLILVTGVWNQPIHESMLVQTALGQYFPYMNFFMPLFFFLLGYSTIIAYFCVGLKSAEHLSPKRGRRVFYIYSVIALTAFSFVETHEALVVMSITQALLLVINLSGMFKLHKEISYNLDGAESQPAPVASQILAS